MVEVDALRFGVGSEQFGYSFVWRVWHHKGKSDVFVAARMTAGTYKVSLHESGQCHVGFTSAQAKKSGIGRSRRLWKKWDRPEPENGLSIPFRLVVPVQSLSSSMPKQQGKRKKATVWIEPVPDHPPTDDTVPAVVVAFAFVYRRLTDVEWERYTPAGSAPIGGIHGLPNGQDLVTFTYPVFTDLHLNRNPKTRKAISEQLSESTPKLARGMTFGNLSDGGVYLCELGEGQLNR